MDQHGPDRPVAAPAHWPGGLRRHLETRGESILVGLLQLAAPGSDCHAGMGRRFAEARERPPPGWSWLGDAELAGETVDQRAFLVHQPCADGALWLVHRWGPTLPLGDDLETMVATLFDGAFFRLELESGRRVAGAIALPDDLTAAFMLEPSDDTTSGDPSAELAVALAEGSEPAIDGAFERLMERYAPVLALEVAEQRAKGAPSGEELLDTIAILRKRRPEYALLAQARSLGDVDRIGPLETLGLRGNGSPPADLVRRAAMRPALPVGESLADSLALVSDLTTDDPETLAAYLEALGECSPGDALVALATLEPPLVGSEPEGSTERMLASYPKAWPVLVLQAFGRRPEFALRALAAVRDPRIVGPLDAFLLAKPDGKWWNGSAPMAAELRLANAPLNAAVVARAATRLAALGEPPARYGAYTAEGLFALLGRSARPDALALLEQHLTWNAYGALRALRHAGDIPEARSLAEAIWARPDRVPAPVARDAAAIAASWGDDQAKSALPALEKRAAAEARAFDRM